MAGAMKVFDRGAVRRHRERASPGFAGHRFLVAEVAERLADRLSDVTREFTAALDLGCHSGELAAALKGRQRSRADAFSRWAGASTIVIALRLSLVHRLRRIVRAGARRDTALRVDRVNHLSVSVH